MDIIWYIGLRSVEIFTLGAGVLGLILSFLLILSPERIWNLSRRLDYWFPMDEKLSFLDNSLTLDRFIYRHRMIAGVFMMAASSFFLVFLFFTMDTDKFLELFFYGHRLLPIIDIVLRASVILGKISGFTGLILGFLFVFAIDKLMILESKTSSGPTAQPLIDKLNAFHDGIDRLFVKYPVLLGLAGLAASVFLTFLGITFLFVL